MPGEETRVSQPTTTVSVPVRPLSRSETARAAPMPRDGGRVERVFAGLAANPVGAEKGAHDLRSLRDRGRGAREGSDGRRAGRGEGSVGPVADRQGGDVVELGRRAHEVVERAQGPGDDFHRAPPLRAFEVGLQPGLREELVLRVDRFRDAVREEEDAVARARGGCSRSGTRSPRSPP